MKKPRDKYKKEFKTNQIILIKNQNIFIFIKMIAKLNIWQANTC
jgi:hypothetical protein